MENVKLSEFEIIPIVQSVRKEEISDDVYFSNKYNKYVSNSRLKYINPEEGGTPQLFKTPPHLSTASLTIGNATHCVLLQNEEFELAPKLNKPTAKLGAVIDNIYNLRKKGYSIKNAICESCNKISYYTSTIEKKIPFIISKGLKYYLSRLDFDKTAKEKESIFLSNVDHDIVTSCLKSCNDNSEIINKLRPKDIFGDPIQSYCEDALFMDFIVTYKDRFVKIPFKLKIDNWTIDEENKILVLNDLKTSGKPANWFMNPKYGSFYKYRYYRQMGIYSYILKQYCASKFGFNKDWTFLANILVVETFGEFNSKCYPISKKEMDLGYAEFEQLMKRIAYHKLFGYNKNVNFIN